MLQADVETTPAEATARPHWARHRLWLLLPLALLAAALVATAVLWPRAPELVPYVSPPLDASGARLHILVPRGWRATTRSGTPLLGSSAQFVTFLPPEPLASLPPWLRRWMPVHAEPGAAISIIIWRDRLLPTDPQANITFSSVTFQPVPASGRRIYAQHRTLERGGIEAQLDYYRTDRAAYDRTQTAIAHSMTIGR